MGRLNDRMLFGKPSEPITVPPCKTPPGQPPYPVQPEERMLMVVHGAAGLAKFHKHPQLMGEYVGWVPAMVLMAVNVNTGKGRMLSTDVRMPAIPKPEVVDDSEGEVGSV